jgi:5-methylcytosine-specific restriction endonuclease McrA
MDDARIKFKRGEIRDDGMIFWRYQSRGDEYWVTALDFHLKKERDALSSKQYRIAHAKKYKSWFQNNKHKVNNIAATRRARKKLGCRNLSDWDKIIIDELYLAAKRIEKCTGLKFEIDHVIPLSKGGLHHPTNLQLLAASINRKKHAKLNFKY